MKRVSTLISMLLLTLPPLAKGVGQVTVPWKGDDKWHELVLVTQDEEMRLSLDGAILARHRSEGFAHPFKRWFSFLVPTTVWIDDVEIRRVGALTGKPEAAVPRQAAQPVDPQPPAKILPLPGELFRIEGRTAFLIPSEKADPGRPVPWVWYAPTLARLPGQAEEWMFQRFLQAGIAIAGIDVGESFGNRAGQALYSSLYRELTVDRGYSRKPVLLGRSRGGLMTLGWAVEHPDKLAAFAGIYPVSNLASYPGLKRAAGAYSQSAEELGRRLAEFNPIDRMAPLARAGVPLFAIHGDDDKVVPLEANSGRLKERYLKLGGSMELIIPEGQGHNMWPGFFQCEELVEFVLRHARTEASRE